MGAPSDDPGCPYIWSGQSEAPVCEVSCNVRAASSSLLEIRPTPIEAIAGYIISGSMRLGPDSDPTGTGDPPPVPSRRPREAQRGGIPEVGVVVDLHHYIRSEYRAKPEDALDRLVSRPVVQPRLNGCFPLPQFGAGPNNHDQVASACLEPDVPQHRTES